MAVSGSFEVLIDDGQSKRSIKLAGPHNALHVVPGIWRDLRSFSSGSTCLVLASSRFDEGDYLRKYGEFRDFKGR